MKIDLSKISIDGGTQPREDIDEEIVSEYAEAMQEGDEFPPVVIFNDGVKYWLADGFHRYHASKKVGYIDIEAEIKQGTKRDAVLYSVSANSKHGLRRSNADKRKAVLTLLNDDEWRQWSDREIARQCSVSDRMVNKYRPTAKDSQIESRKVKRGDQEYSVDTSNIGKQKERFDAETGEIIDDGTITDENREWAETIDTKSLNERKGIGLEKAHEAIGKLKQIPPDDGLLQDAYDTVTRWIEHNR